MNTDTLTMLARLWLHEPDEAMLSRARDALALPGDAQPAELALAYADLFLLNVYPYGTAYSDAWGELNTPEARRVSAKFEAFAYQPKELRETGAPDHLGLCLGFLGYLLSLETSSARSQAGRFVAQLQEWAPVCCLAAEREPGVHPFYRALAQRTRDVILGGEKRVASGDDDVDTQLATRLAPLQVAANPEDEFRLRDVVRMLLIPARCGMFLSRGRLGRLANALDMRLPFGSRFEVAEWLFASAGESEQVLPLVESLKAEAAAWEVAYRDWAARWPAWQSHAADWLSRVLYTQSVLGQMEQQVQSGVDVSFALPNDPEPGFAEG